MDNIDDLLDEAVNGPKHHWQVACKPIDSPTTAVELLDMAKSYFGWCDENPIRTSKTLTSGKEAGKTVVNIHPRPYTIKGLCLHCNILEEYFADLLNSKVKTSLYYIVAKKILYIIHTQNAELATVGVFNPIFTARMLNMEEPEEVARQVKIEIVNGLPPLAKSENEILEKLEMEKRDSETPREQ